MAKSRGRQRGQALVLVFGVVIMATAVVTGLYNLLASRTEDLILVVDRVKARYMCEAAVSMALMDLQIGILGGGPGQVMNRSFTYYVGNTPYTLSYDTSYDAAKGWTIKGIAPSPGGLGLTYTLTFNGRRTFPLFILGTPLH